jgi:carbon storage regulator
MLVIRRKAGESLIIANQVRVTVLETHGGGVKIGIEAPAEVSVHRAEVAEAVERANREAAMSPPAQEWIALLKGPARGREEREEREPGSPEG